MGKKHDSNFIKNTLNAIKRPLYLTSAGLMSLYLTSCEPDRAKPEFDHPNYQKIGKTKYKIIDRDEKGVFSALPPNAAKELFRIEDSCKQFLRTDIKGTNFNVIDCMVEADKLLYKYHDELLEKGVIVNKALYSSKKGDGSAGIPAIMIFEYTLVSDL